MVNRRVLGNVLVLVAALVLGMVLGPWLVGSLSGVALSEEVAAVPAQEVEPAAPTSHICSISEVGVFDSRIHVKCYTGGAPGGDIVYFAAPTTDTQRAARLLSLMLTADAAGKRLYIAYDTAASGAAFNCAVSNCRPIQFLLMVD